MATNYYSDLMKGYTGSPSFQPQLDMGMQAISRKVPRGSGNVLAALTKYATDLSASDYGNEFDRRLRAQQLGQEGDLAGQRLDLDRTLGTGRLDLDRALGTGRLGIEQGDLELRRLTGDRDFALGSQRTQNEWDLGNRRAGNEEMDSWRRYDLGGRRQALDESTAANDFTLRNDANSRGWYDSQTQRGAARSADWGRRNPTSGGSGAGWSGGGGGGWSGLPRQAGAAPVDPWGEVDQVNRAADRRRAALDRY